MGKRTESFTLFYHAKIEKEPRKMRFDLNALADFEQQCGMGIGQLLQMKAVFASTRAMLWCGSHHADPMFTIDAAGELIQKYLEGGHGTISDVMASCFEIASRQGALGSMKKKDDDDSDDDSDDNPSADPNVIEATATQTDQPSPAGASGSKKPKGLPSAPSN